MQLGHTAEDDEFVDSDEDSDDDGGGGGANNDGDDADAVSKALAAVSTTLVDVSEPTHRAM